MRTVPLVLLAFVSLVPLRLHAQDLLRIDIHPGEGASNPVQYFPFQGAVYFSADDGTNGAELWRSDGTAEGTVLVKDIHPGEGDSSPLNFAELNGVLYFRANDGATGYELWRSDGTSGGTTRVKDINPGPDWGSGSVGLGSPLVVHGGQLFFLAGDASTGDELWRSDGTEAGTVLVKDIWPGTTSGRPTSFVTLGDALYFVAREPNTRSELWRSDGTSGGTTLVKDVNPGSGDGLGSGINVQYLHVLGGAIYFAGDDGGAAGSELWRSDGTAEGTVLFSDILAGDMSSFPSNLAVSGDQLFFTARDGSTGNELWRTDGTGSGTVLVKDIHPGASSSLVSNPVALGGDLYFTADDGTSGRELWRSDGTADGTALVKDIAPPTSFDAPIGLLPFAGRMFFRADDGESGDELWVSDGTEGGTRLVSDIAPGRRESFATPGVGLGTALFFSADDGTNGSELWVLRDAATPSEPGPAAATLEVRALPNPVASSLTVSIALQASAPEAVVALYDARGRRVAVLHDGPLAAGQSRLQADTGELPAGAYLVRVHTPEGAASRWVTVVR